MERIGRRLFSAREAADFLGISLNTLRRIEKARLLVPYRTPGGHRKYSAAMLEEYLENSRQNWGRRKGRSSYQRMASEGG